jgi:hypothetical protein
MPNPQLTLCVVTRNAAIGLERTLESIHSLLALKLSLCVELLIIDGESTDHTSIVLDRWRRRLGPLCLLQLIVQPPSGIYPAMNLAVRQARSPWLLFINAGDLLLDLSHIATVLVDESPSAADAYLFQAALFHPGLNWALLPVTDPAPCHQALVYRKCLHQRFGYYHERLQICSDTLFMQRLFNSGKVGYRIQPIAASEVGPRDASRDPSRILADVALLQSIGSSLRPWRRLTLTLWCYRMERLLGISITVWLRGLFGLILGQYHLIRLPILRRV